MSATADTVLQTVGPMSANLCRTINTLARDVSSMRGALEPKPSIGFSKEETA